MFYRILSHQGTTEDWYVVEASHYQHCWKTSWRKFFRTVEEAQDLINKEKQNKIGEIQ